MSKKHRARKHSKAKTKEVRIANKPESTPDKSELSDVEYYENYRKNSRKTFYGIAAIAFLVLLLLVLVGLDVSGCQFLETEEELENCQSYTLLEKILYGGAYQAPESSAKETQNIEEQVEEK